ncbi:hypothetical protein U1Q18_009869 [Sarracenia purpurea var. burkii]
MENRTEVGEMLGGLPAVHKVEDDDDMDREDEAIENEDTSRPFQTYDEVIDLGKTGTVGNPVESLLVQTQPGANELAPGCAHKVFVDMPLNRGMAEDKDVRVDRSEAKAWSEEGSDGNVACEGKVSKLPKSSVRKQGKTSVEISTVPGDIANLGAPSVKGSVLGMVVKRKSEEIIGGIDEIRAEGICKSELEKPKMEDGANKKDTDMEVDVSEFKPNPSIREDDLFSRIDPVGGNVKVKATTEASHTGEVSNPKSEASGDKVLFFV